MGATAYVLEIIFSYSQGHYTEDLTLSTRESVAGSLHSLAWQVCACTPETVAPQMPAAATNFRSLQMCYAAF